MTLTAPAPTQPGTLYQVNYQFTNYESGALTDPNLLQLNFTYGSALGSGGVEVAGPFEYTGASASSPGVLWRTGTGQYSFLWQIPGDALTGVYVANWTATVGADTILATENFPVVGGGPFTPVPSGDAGFWTGSLSYQPAWASEPVTVPFGSTDANGVTWILKSVKGWDGPPTVGSVIQRSADHGGWPSAQYYGPRLITLDVMISAPDQATRDLAKQQLIQACPVSDLATFTYNEPVPKQCQVRQNGSANIAFTPLTLCDIGASVPLIAPDPRKYAVTPMVQTATLPAPVINPLTLPVTLPIGFPGSTPPIDSAITCVNSGTFETRPVITISGPLTNPQIVNAATGQTVSFTGLSLAASDQLVISTDARQAYLNGGTFYPADISSAWWVLEPGTTQVYLTGDNFSGGGTITVSYASAWA